MSTQKKPEKVIDIPEEKTNMVLYRIREWEKENDLTFKPKNSFYKRVGINRKRWGLLVSGDLKGSELFLYESKILASYFNVSIECFISCQPRNKQSAETLVNEKGDYTAPNKEWLRPKEVQAYLGVGHDTYYKMARNGLFPVSKPNGKLAYVKKSDLDALLDKRMQTK